MNKGEKNKQNEKYLELDDKAYKNLWSAAEALLRGKFIVLHAILEKKKS